MTALKAVRQMRTARSKIISFAGESLTFPYNTKNSILIGRKADEFDVSIASGQLFPQLEQNILYCM
jgi:hypothetical protein